MKKLKDIIDSIIFIMLFFGFPIIAGIIVELLCNIITMEMIMNVLGILTILAIIYVMKN